MNREQESPKMPPQLLQRKEKGPHAQERQFPVRCLPA